MSRAADVANCLNEMLRKHDSEHHEAIVETFSLMLEDDWEEENVARFFHGGLGISIKGDKAIRHEARYHGVEKLL